MVGYIYLIQLREFNRINEQTYKIGRTENINRRKKEYPKDSIQLYSRAVNNEFKLEILILDKLKIVFKQEQKYGTEYFSGEYTKMIKLINKIIDKHDDSISENKNHIIESYAKIKILFVELIDSVNQKELITNVYTSNHDLTNLTLINTNIENTIENYNKLINNDCTNINKSILLCEFKNHCEKCDNSTEYSFCTEQCDICCTFRVEERKTTTANAKKYYNEYLKNLKEIETNIELNFMIYFVQSLTDPIKSITNKELYKKYCDYIADKWPDIKIKVIINFELKIKALNINGIESTHHSKLIDVNKALKWFSDNKYLDKIQENTTTYFYDDFLIITKNPQDYMTVSELNKLIKNNVPLAKMPAKTFKIMLKSKGCVEGRALLQDTDLKYQTRIWRGLKLKTSEEIIS